MLRAREGPGCEAAACRILELGPVCPRDSLGSEAQRCQLEMPLGDLDPSPVTDLGAPSDLWQLPEIPLPPVSERRGSQGSEGCIPPGSSCPRPLWVRALGGSGAQKRSSSEAGCVAGAHGKRPD